MRVPDYSHKDEDDGRGAAERLYRTAVLLAAAGDEVVDGGQRDLLGRQRDELLVDDGHERGARVAPEDGQRVERLGHVEHGAHDGEGEQQHPHVGGRRAQHQPPPQLRARQVSQVHPVDEDVTRAEQHHDEHPRQASLDLRREETRSIHSEQSETIGGGYKAPV